MSNIQNLDTISIINAAENEGFGNFANTSVAIAESAAAVSVPEAIARADAAIFAEKVDAQHVENRGRKALLTQKKKLAVLLAGGDFSGLTNYTKQILVDAGYIAVEKVKSGKRGRPAEILTLRGKGLGLVALSKKCK